VASLGLLVLATPLAARAIEYIRSCETEAVANHSIRSFLFAAMLAEHQRLRPAADFDPDLLFFACLLHDLALHTSPGLAERRGALAYLTRAGIGMDFGRGSEFITDDQARAIHASHPRLRMATALTDEIVRHAARSPLNAPLYTLAGELVRERSQDGGLTSLERAAQASRWGE
jgi:HD domain